MSSQKLQVVTNKSNITHKNTNFLTSSREPCEHRGWESVPLQISGRSLTSPGQTLLSLENTNALFPIDDISQRAEMHLGPQREEPSLHHLSKHSHIIVCECFRVQTDISKAKRKARLVQKMSSVLLSVACANSSSAPAFLGRHYFCLGRTNPAQGLMDSYRIWMWVSLRWYLHKPNIPANVFAPSSDFDIFFISCVQFTN